MQFLNGSFLLITLLVALLIPFVKKRSLLFATLFLSLALARPVIFDGYKTIKDSNIEVVLALDLSRSMELDDIKPSRRDVAIEKLKKFVLLSDDFPMALIIFGRKSEIVVPMTTDKALILERLSTIGEFDYAKGTNYKDVIKNATLLFSSLNRHIIFFTDGGDKADSQGMARLAKRLHIALHSLTIATHRTMMIDSSVITFNRDFKDEILKNGGVYKEVTMDHNDIEEILDMLMLKAKDGVVKVANQRELFYIPTLIALAILLAKRYLVTLFILALFIQPNPLEANFLGFVQLKLHNYDLAVKLLSPPKDDVEKYNLAYALEKLGRLDEARKLLETVNPTDNTLKKKVTYNLAMIYAKQKEYQKALTLLMTLKKCCNNKKIEKNIALIQSILKRKRRKLPKKQNVTQVPKRVVKKFIPVTLGDGGGYGGKPW